MKKGLHLRAVLFFIASYPCKLRPYGVSSWQKQNIMVPKKKVIISSLIAVALLIYAAIGFSDYFKGSRDREMQALGEKLMEQIDAYKAAENHLPATLLEVGLVQTPDGGALFEGETFYYTLWNDRVYSIEYVSEEGRNMVRLSDADEWEVSYSVNMAR